MSDTKQAPPRASKAPDVFAARGIRNPAILEAMRSVQREDFPPSPLSIPPDVVGRVLEALELSGSDRVLKLGAGTGWAAALLAHLAKETWVVERDVKVASAVRDPLQKVGKTNENVVAGDWGDTEVVSHGPYEAILISQPVPDVPSGLAARLAPGGRMVAIIESEGGRRHLTRFRFRIDGTRTSDDLGELRPVPLLGDVLVATGRVSRGTVEAAASSARDRGVTLGEQLLASGACEEIDLFRALAKQSDLPFADAGHLIAELDAGLVAKYPRKFLEHHRVIPIRESNGELTVATADPSLAPWEVTQAFDAKRVVVRIVTPTDYRRIWAALDLGEATVAAEALASEQRVDEPEEAPEEASRWSATFDTIVQDAIAERASDVHFECHERSVRVRFRVDGSLQDIGRYDFAPRDLAALVNVIKIAATLDISERRLPQGGRIHKRFGERAFDMRVQTQPSLHGENVVIRLIPQESRVPSIEELGFPSQVAERYRTYLASPHGMILVVGPT
jgi:type IV pilus assembly protein PilB